MSDWIPVYCDHTLLQDRPWVLLCWGAPAAGKSTVAKTFCQQHQVPRLSSDAVNQALIGDRFQAELRPVIYQGLLAMAEAILQGGGRLVLDGTFLDPASRQRVAQLAQKYGAVFLSVQVHCSLGERIRRNARRPSAERVPDAWLSNAHSRAALTSLGELTVDSQRHGVDHMLQLTERHLIEKLRRAHGLQRRRPAMDGRRLKALP